MWEQVYSGLADAGAWFDAFAGQPATVGDVIALGVAIGVANVGFGTWLRSVGQYADVLEKALWSVDKQRQALEHKFVNHVLSSRAGDKTTVGIFESHNSRISKLEQVAFPTPATNAKANPAAKVKGRGNEKRK